jgi:hypothetical protein
MIVKVVKDYPFQLVATTLRKAKTATRNDWGAICYSDGNFYQAESGKTWKSLIEWEGGFLCIRSDLRLPLR